ncbi:MAG: type II toxin-antitoxin system VapC family toxin [Planctomycetales bacterium]|nr:type II toxin-antitoxin system VapC family toxin [Planctomycetales bacterium]
MTAYLVDTHVLLDWASSPDGLSPESRLVMATGRNELFFSYASLWELNIKISLGKLSLPESTDVMLQKARCKSLPILVEHIATIKDLPHHHRDPFDRMLISQAINNRMTLITRDREIRKYDVPTIAA